MENFWQGCNDFDTLAKAQAQYLNEQGKDNARCSVCLDKGNIFFVQDGELMARHCDCRKIRKAEAQLNASGLTPRLQKHSFNTFLTKEPWQEGLLQQAKQFAAQCLTHRNDEQGWLYLGGQVGCGKTHLCASILFELLSNGIAARYVVWPNEAEQLKANCDGFQARLTKLAEVPVLYLDDFLKCPNGRTRGDALPSAAELQAAIRLINSRYINEKSITIFSSEWYLHELTTFDSGMAGRIYERCGSFRLEVVRDTKKNQRFL